MRLAVIGAGVVGAAVARAAARRGADVTVFDGERPGAGTSGTTFAWVNAHDKEPYPYFALNRAGLDAHVALQEEDPAGPRWLFPTGNLEWAAGDDHAARMRASVERLAARGYPAELVGLDQARRIAPDAVIPDDAAAIAWFAGEAHLHTAPLLARLLGEARDRGARLRLGVPVRSVTGAALALADGTTETFDAVVTCVGRWTEPFLAGCDVTLHMADPDAPGSVTVGYLGYTDPVPTRLATVLTTPRLNVRPDGGGRLVVQGLDLDATADPSRTPEPSVAAELESRLRTALRGAEHARVREVRVGQRAMPADGLTAAGFVDATRTHYVIATHSGVTLCLHLAHLATTELLDQSEEPTLTDFRPQRLSVPIDPSRVPAPRRPGQQ